MDNEYLKSCLNETLRMYTPVPGLFPRLALVDHKLENIFIKKGTIV